MFQEVDCDDLGRIFDVRIHTLQIIQILTKIDLHQEQKPHWIRKSTTPASPPSRMAPPANQQHPRSAPKYLLPLRHLQRAFQRLPLAGFELLLRALVRRSRRATRVRTRPQGPQPPVKSTAFIITPRSRHRLRLGRSEYQGGADLRVPRNGANPVRETEDPR